MGRAIDRVRRREWEERLRRYADSRLTVRDFYVWENSSAPPVNNPGRTRHSDTVPATPDRIEVRLTNGVRIVVPCTDGGRVMLTCPTHLPIDFCTTPVDFRKSFDGLSGVITAVFGSSVLDSHLLLFINKRRDRIPIDSNDVEQLMKQVATGRKNWMFLRSPDAGDRAATLPTLISTALQHDLDVWAYLKAAIDQLQAGSTDYHSLRPEVSKLAHPQFVRTDRTEEHRDAATRTRLTRAQRRLANAKKQSAR